MSGENFESIWSHLAQVPFRQAWANVNRVSTRYIEAGDPAKPTVIFIHGIGGSWEAFCANIGPFSRNFHVVALDCLGAGFTGKPKQDIYEMTDYVAHLHGFFTERGIERASLVGVSMGGWLAVNFTHRYPALVDRLVLCAASGLKRYPSHTPPAAAAIASERAKAIDDPSWENIASIFTDLMISPEKRNPDFIKLRQTVYRLPEMKPSMKAILAITKTENFNRSALSDDQWRSIDKPVLLIESTDDSEHFRKNTARAHALLPNSRVFSMNGVAHWPQWEDPDTFNREAIAFLREQQA